MATYKGDGRFRYKCAKCMDPISDQAHAYCVIHNYPDLCFTHQPGFVRKSIRRYEKKGTIKYREEVK